MRIPVSLARPGTRGAALVAAVFGTTIALMAADDVTVQNTTVASGVTDNRQANVSVTATNNYNVASGGQSNLTAGIRVTLSPNVHVFEGGGLHAIVDFNHNGTSDWLEESQGASTLPYLTGFEAGGGFSTGNLNAQGGWYSGPATVSVAAMTAADGAWAVSIPAGTPTNSATKHFRSSGQSPTYVDFFVVPVFTGSLNMSSYLDTASAQVGFLRTDEDGGRLQVLTSGADGAAQWLTVGPSVPLNSSFQAVNWLRVTLRLNYASRIWDLFLNGQMVASGLPLNSTDTSLPFFTLYGSTASATDVDAVYVGSSDPLPADTSAPTVPAALSAQTATATSISLFWSPSSGASGVGGYNIYRNGTLIGSTSGLRTYFTDQNLSPNATYIYTVQALNTSGVASGQSVALSASTAGASTPNLEIFTPLK